MKKNPTEILIEKNISITSPRLLIIEKILNNKNPISIEKPPSIIIIGKVVSLSKTIGWRKK